MKKLLISTLLLSTVFLTGCAKEEEVLEKTDAQVFSEEYNSVSEENIFEIKNASEIIKILENGTGIVYLGYPECPWCVAYVPYLNEVAMAYGISEINYFNIKDDRAENTEDYQKIVTLLEEYLQYDADGNKRVYVPSIVVVLNGKIVAFDDETSFDTKGFENPEDYWSEENVNLLKDKLGVMIENISQYSCTSC